MKKATVQKLHLKPGRRVLAVSDVHGDLPLFRRLLDKARLTDGDVLFVLGDVLEKGAESLATLRFLMTLSARYEVHILNGNCDDLVAGFVDGREELSDDFFRYYIGQFGARCTLVQMGREAELGEAQMEDYPLFRAVLRERFKPELDFLRALPTIIETDKLLFVHGGVPSTRHMEQLDAWRCMKNDDFLSQGVHLDKWCVAGHWPTTLYRPYIPSADPLISREKKIVSIDGGCSIKPDGQLNLLVLENGFDERFPFISADHLPVVTALDRQEASAASINVRWGLNRVEVLEPGPEFSRCRHLESGVVIDILTDQLFAKDGVLRCQDSTDYRLEVHPGDSLSVVRFTSRGLLAKKGGVTGWYRGRIRQDFSPPGPARDARH